MPFATAIASILTLFLCIWALKMARDPKTWRLWWMHHLGIVDINSSREQRRRQEKQLSTLAYMVYILCLVGTFSCVYWTAMGIKAALKPKTQLELDLERTRRQAEEIHSQKPFRRLD